MLLHHILSLFAYIPGKPGFCFHYYCAIYDEFKYYSFVHNTISLSSLCKLIWRSSSVKSWYCVEILFWASVFLTMVSAWFKLAVALAVSQNPVGAGCGWISSALAFLNSSKVREANILFVTLALQIGLFGYLAKLTFVAWFRFGCPLPFFHVPADCIKECFLSSHYFLFLFIFHKLYLLMEISMRKLVMWRLYVFLLV